MTSKTIIRNHKQFILITTSLTIFNALITLLIPLLLKNIYAEDYQLNSGTLILVVMCLFLAFSLQLSLLFLRENFAEKFNLTNSRTYFQQLFKMSYDALIKLEPTYLVNRSIDSVDSLYTFFTNSLVNLLGNSLIIFLALIIFWLIQPSLAIFISLVFPLNFFGYRLINQKLQEKSQVMAEKNSTSIKEIVNIFQNVEYIKQNPDFQHVEALITPPLTSLYHQMANINKYAKGTSLSIELLNNFIQNMMFLWLAIAASSSAGNLADLVVASVLFPIYFNSVKSFNQINFDLKQLKVAETFFQTELQQNQEPDGKLLLDKISTIEMGKVTINFPSESKTYQINQAFQKSDLVYISGKSGIGKSTLVKALLKFRPTVGIRINGQSLSDLCNQSLRQKIGYLAQDNVIISGTLKENLLLGHSPEGINWEELENSTLLAPLFLTKNWDSPIFEGGTNLSGGEKQRLGIARLLIEEFDVLVLDEITSNLDETSAADIMATLLAQKEKIIFYISHDQAQRHYCTKEIML